MNIFENVPRSARWFVENFSRKVDDMFNLCWGRCDRKWRFSNQETAFAKVQNFSNDLGRADISKLSAEAFICLKSIIDWFQKDKWSSGCAAEAFIILKSIIGWFQTHEWASGCSEEAFICLKSIIGWFQTDEWTSGCPECRFAEWNGRKKGAGGGVGREEACGRRSGAGEGVALIDFSIRNCQKIFKWKQLHKNVDLWKRIQIKPLATFSFWKLFSVLERLIISFGMEALT